MYGMMKQKLEARAEQGKPVQVGFVGAGRMGTGGMCQNRRDARNPNLCHRGPRRDRAAPGPRALRP